MYIPFTCSNYFEIKDEDKITLTVTVNSVSTNIVYPLQKQFMNVVHYINFEHISKRITSINITATSTVELTLLKMKGQNGSYNITNSPANIIFC